VVIYHVWLEDADWHTHHAEMPWCLEPREEALRPMLRIDYTRPTEQAAAVPDAFLRAFGEGEA
jgi:hypothetical protein